LTFLDDNQHTLEMQEKMYVAVKVPGWQLADLMDWLSDHTPSWSPVPCTSWTRESLTEHLKMINYRHNGEHRIPFTVHDAKDLVMLKLTWDVVDQYPMSEHQ
jgi:hypothetical protein